MRKIIEGAAHPEYFDGYSDADITVGKTDPLCPSCVQPVRILNEKNVGGWYQRAECPCTAVQISSRAGWPIEKIIATHAKEATK